MMTIEEAAETLAIKRLTPAVWAKWDGKLYNWALCYGGSERRTVPAIEARYDEKHWSEYCDDFGRNKRKRGFQGAETWETPEPPGITVEAIDTNALVILLPAKLHSAVRAQWCASGPAYLRADTYGMSERTLYNRCRAAVVELEIMDGARKRRSGPAVVRRSQIAPLAEVA